MGDQPARSPDRRVRRTRASIRRALIDLSLERDFDDIGIHEILARADVARATFYAHYDDKNAVLDEMSDELIAAVAAATAVAVEATWPTYSTAAMEALCTVVGDNRDLVRLMIRGAGDGRPVQRWLAQLTEGSSKGIRRRDEAAGREPRLPYELISRSFASQTLGVISWWLEDAPDRTPAQVAVMFRQINMLGEAWARNVAVEDLHIEDLQVD